LWESAVKHRECALSILREYKDQLGVGRCLGNLGDIRLDQGRLDDALAHYLECADVMERLGSPYETARAMRRLSEVFSRKGDQKRAAEYERQGRDLDSRAWSIAW
jgi:tetratricopeptide (TPR) repeat protein